MVGGGPEFEPALAARESEPALGVDVWLTICGPDMSQDEERSRMRRDAEKKDEDKYEEKRGRAV
eukprot:2529994-Rhodomonas_salina.1